MNLFGETALGNMPGMTDAPGLIIDNFAGGGGASTGIEQALGRAVDIAINHDEDAIRMHEANHPGTHHIRNNIWQIDPTAVTKGKPVELAWFSPDCKHFSKAKGGKPREKSVRDLAWVVVLWAEKVKPTLILLENVEEFRTWGPLDDEGQPIKERAGETFAKWSAQLRKAGYKTEWKELRACDYGAPTIRKRFFMIARCDGQPIVWPNPSHGHPESPEVLSGARQPWKTAADIIDWSIPCPSIFDRKKPLAEKTLRRIAHGIMKFVVNNPKPFVVPLTHHGSDGRSYSLDEPLVTVTGANRGELAIAQPFLSPVKTWGGGGNGPRSLHEPMRTTTTSKGGEHALVTPYFTRTAHGDVDKSGKRRGQPCHGPEVPFPTVLQSQDSALIVPHITRFRTGHIGHAIDVPLSTITANSFIKRPGGAAPLGLVNAVIAPVVSYGQQGGNNRPADAPMHTVTASLKDTNQVVQAALAPVVVGTAFKNTRAARAFDTREPLRTQTSQPEYGVAAAHLVHVGNGERQGQHPRAMTVEAPLGTVVAGGIKHRVVQAFMEKFATAHIEQANGGPKNENLAGRAADEPLSTVATTGSQQRLVTSNLVKLRGTCQHGQPVDEPLATVTGCGNHIAEVRAFLLRYFGTDQDPRLEEPLGTATSKHRDALVTVMIEGEEYVITDIGMRMLTPGELFAAQSFPPTYIIDRDAQGRPMTKTSQVARCGNSVPPVMAEALTWANAPSLAAARAAAFAAEAVQAA